MLRYVLALLLIPLLDAIFLVYVATAWLGAVPTVALVVLTALVGTLLVRAEGRRTIRKLQTKLGRGEVPTNELMDGGLLIAAGAFLLTPGLVTDALGFVLVVPLTRIPIRMALKKYVVTPYLDQKTGGFATGNVYTFGFPDPESAGQGDGWTSVDWADAADERTGRERGSDERADDTYDLGADEFDVDERTGGSDGRTGGTDERTDGDDGRGDDSQAR